jgi:hypothetical protein
MFHFNTTLTTTVFVNFGDINITRQMSFFSVYLLGKIYRTALQQILQMPTTRQAFTKILLPVSLLFLFDTSLLGYALLNASCKAVNDFNAK